MRGSTAIVRNEARIVQRDPIPIVILVLMPIVLMAFLTPALKLTLASEGYAGVGGSSQSVPGMVCVFSWFVVAFVGFAIFREHGWGTWDRLRASGVGHGELLLGKLALPAAMLAIQHLALFGVGTALLGLEVTGSWLALALVSAAFGAMILLAGLAASATFATMAQVNAVVNLGSMVLGGLGGGFVPVDTLPGWVQPLAPASPTYWAMRGYRAAVLDGGGVAQVVGSVAVLAGFAVVFGAIALRKLRVDAPKRTWG